MDILTSDFINKENKSEMRTKVIFFVTLESKFMYNNHGGIKTVKKYSISLTKKATAARVVIKFFSWICQGTSASTTESVVLREKILPWEHLVSQTMDKFENTFIKAFSNFFSNSSMLLFSSWTSMIYWKTEHLPQIDKISLEMFRGKYKFSR